MKYYQSTFKEYLMKCREYDLHPYLSIPQEFISHTIIFGSPGIGKYTQAIKMISPFSPSDLRYEKKLICINDKGEHSYKMSDIHFEIDMAILGCNAKQLWNDIFIQIIEIVALRDNKNTIIICKNFHQTHNELLDLFYNYIQQSRNNIYGIKISFIFLCESISLLPNNVIKSCNQIGLKRPNNDDYTHIFSNIEKNMFSDRRFGKQTTRRIQTIFNKNENMELTNLKELYTLDLLDNASDTFNTICDNLINFMKQFHEKPDFLQLRELLYDILIYDINVSECLYYMYEYFINNEMISPIHMNQIIQESAEQLKLYNNNYRPIYHLERIFYNIVRHLQHNES